MGIDACIHFTSETKILEEELKKASYDIACVLPDIFQGSYEYMDYPITYNEDEDIYEVNIFMRYYGPGYERGYWPDIYATLFWLQNRFPKSKIYYYGDSGGEESEKLVTSELIINNFQHWIKYGHDPYRRYFGQGEKGCNKCTKPLLHTGGGQGKELFSCPACQKRFIKSNGKLEETEKF